MITHITEDISKHEYDRSLVLTEDLPAYKDQYSEMGFEVKEYSGSMIGVKFKEGGVVQVVDINVWREWSSTWYWRLGGLTFCSIYWDCKTATPEELSYCSQRIRTPRSLFLKLCKY